MQTVTITDMLLLFNYDLSAVVLVHPIEVNSGPYGRLLGLSLTLAGGDVFHYPFLRQCWLAGQGPSASDRVDWVRAWTALNAERKALIAAINSSSPLNFPS